MTELNKVDALLVKRGKKYGDVVDQAYVAEMIKGALRGGRTWAALDNVMKQSLEVIALKMSRIVSGDPYHADSWFDIEGYAKLGRNRCPGIESDGGEV